MDKRKKVFFILVDNFCYDQWCLLRELINEFYHIEEEKIYCAMLPTATQYARNAIFSGLFPKQIQEMFPEFWVEEEEEEGKNLHKKELLETQIQRFQK